MNIRKRKRGTKTYYYLGHSIRKGDKVTKKELFLGETIPPNIEEIKENFMKELKSELYQKLESIKNDFQKEWGKTPDNARKKQLEEVSIAFTYNTNAIEGSTITLEEAREIIHDKIAPNKPLDEVKETEAHNKVFFEMISKKEKISEKLLLSWHEKLFNETKPDLAGKYREYLVIVGSYIAPDWQDVKELMKKLVGSIEKNNKMNAVELAGKAHYQFEKIHPFGDGNGRIGRLLMNKILWDNKYPMLIIEKRGRKSYYTALKRGEEGFTKYFIKRYLTVHKKRIR